MQAKQTPEGTQLIPVNWDAPHEEALLREQRLICGWGEPAVALWRDHVRKGLRTLFWVAIPAAGELGTTRKATAAQRGLDTIASAGKTYLAVGHVALDWTDVPSTDVHYIDPTLASEDGSVLTIAALFVMPEFSKFRLGSFAILRAAELATQPPYGSENCTAVTVNTLSPRHTKGGIEGPEGMGAFERMGLSVKDDNLVPWFKQLGFVQYKEAPRYLAPCVDGSTVHLWCVCMRKEVAVKA